MYVKYVFLRVGIAYKICPFKEKIFKQLWSVVLSGYSLTLGLPPSELLEVCERSLDKMGSVFEESNVYMLHMMYQAMGVCLYMQDWEGALRYGQKIIKPYR